MAQGYLGEDRFYITVIDKWEEPTAEGSTRTIMGESLYICWDGETTDEFIDAKHFASREAAIKYREQYKTSGRNVIVRGLHLEINGFDVGTIV
jgi:hypothetical protein